MVDEAGDSFFASSSDPLWHSLLMGNVSGTTCVLAGHPLDSIKTRIQTQAKGPLFARLYRGVLPPLLAVTPAWGAVFVAYGGVLKLIGRDDMAAVALAGASCGIAYSCVVCPFELIKVNAQKQQLTTKESFNQIYKKVGARGMYRGFGACAFRDSTQSAVYYTCAETLTRDSAFSERFGSQTPIVAGAITGVVHCTVEFPSDVVKARMQTNLNLTSIMCATVALGLLLRYAECFRELANVTEMKRVSVALIPTLTRAVFVHAAAFYMVSFAKPYIQAL